MQVEIHGVALEVRKTYYNKTIVQPDGVTHTVDTEHNYPVYQFGMAKNYFDIDNKSSFIKALVSDLRSVAKELEEQLTLEQQNEKDESR